jgi:ADP-ribosylglycohydrolase
MSRERNGDMSRLMDKVVGMFLGIGVGDALGTPVELWKQEDVQAKYGLITGYVKSERHPFHGDKAAGHTTDDTQLTLAVSEGLVQGGGFDMVSMSLAHQKAYKESTTGWGRSTRESLANLCRGVPWDKCAAGTGVGNGVVMKIGPLAALATIQGWDAVTTIQAVLDLTQMTHPTSVAMASSLAHVRAITYCLTTEPSSFNRGDFLKAVYEGGYEGGFIGERCFPDTKKEDLASRLVTLEEAWLWSDREVREKFGKGGCYVYDSLPFTYAHFLREPRSIQSLYECVSNGGDADSNGSILGGLYGALNGSIFPPHLVSGLVPREEVLKAAEAFVAKFLA